MKPKAVILLSGGLDSVTTLAIALSEGYECVALSFEYGQRSVIETKMAASICKDWGVSHRVVTLDIGQFGGSALTDNTLVIPAQETKGIPITYVPARNTIFLSIAMGLAETIGAADLFIGANCVDYSGYPDCRPEFFKQFEQLAALATKAGVEGQSLRIQTPLLYLTKAEIIEKGLSLGIDYSKTCSCYHADENGRACGRCDSCRFRRQGFHDLGVVDPTHYQD